MMVYERQPLPNDKDRRIFSRGDMGNTYVTPAGTAEALLYVCRTIVYI